MSPISLPLLREHLLVDLDLRRLTGRIDDNIRLGQNTLAAWLDMLRESGPAPQLFSWGLSTRYSWLKDGGFNAQGALPLDDDLERNLFWETLRRRWAEA